MGNNSGIDHTVINSRERALSTDLNVLQSQSGKSRAELFRNLISNQNLATTFGFELVQPQDATPLAADIYGGLLSDIQATHILITPGTIGAMSAIGTPDANDSQYVIIDDPGVQLSGTLPFAANAGPGIRVDVLECQPMEVVITTDNRDRFNPTTGLFSPETVNKTVGGRLTFRIRQGTQGAGYPGHATGWLPLTIFMHPSGSLSFDDVQAFDVRPLIQDRHTAYSNYRVSPNFLERSISRTAVQIAGGVTQLQGTYKFNSGGPTSFTSDIGAYRCQGRLQPTNPNVTSEIGDYQLNDTENLVPGADFSTATIKWMYVIAMFPEGLPRWVNYSRLETLGSGERFPKSVMGILATCENSDITNETGQTAGIIPPPIYGLTSTVQKNTIVAVVKQSQNVPEDFVQTFQPSNQRLRWDDTETNAGMVQNGIVIFSNANSAELEFELGDYGEVLAAFDNFIPHTCTGFNFTVTVNFDLAGTATDMSILNLRLARGAGRVTIAQDVATEFIQSHIVIGNGQAISHRSTFTLPNAGNLQAPGNALGSFFIIGTWTTGGTFTHNSSTVSITEVTVGV